MAIAKTVEPYELLFRWRNGALAGAHVQYITVVREDKEVLSESVGDAMPVAVGNAKGFPLDTLLSDVQVAAVARAEQEIAEHKRIAEEMRQQQEKHAQEIGALHAELAALREQLVALTPAA